MSQKDSIPLNSLSQKKRAQLNASTSIPPMYITVESYAFHYTLNAIVYTIEIGIQCDQIVHLKRAQRRFSALRTLDSQIRDCPQFSDSSYLKPFPPKKLLGNKDPAFIEKRLEQLQYYLENLLKVPGVTRSSIFLRFFDIDPERIEHGLD